MNNVIQIRPRRSSPHGTVYLAPVDENGGAWGIFHRMTSKSGVVYLGSRFGFTDAEQFAQAEARRLRAAFDDGSEGAA